MTRHLLKRWASDGVVSLQDAMTQKTMTDYYYLSLKNKTALLFFFKTEAGFISTLFFNIQLGVDATWHSATSCGNIRSNNFPLLSSTSFSSTSTLCCWQITLFPAPSFPSKNHDNNQLLAVKVNVLAIEPVF